MAVATGRPKTLEESKAYLRQHLAERLNPMVSQDPEVAGAAIDRLESLDSDHWASVWAAEGARFEELARAAEARGDTAAADAAYFQAYAFYFLGRFPCANTPRKQENAAKARALFLRAARAFDPPLERVAIPFAGRPGEGQEVIV